MRSLRLGVVVLALLAAACSVPLDESASPIPEDELPDVLVSTTTTTTTTLPEVTTREITYYLVALPEGLPRVLKPVTRTVPAEPDSLTAFLTPAFDPGFRTEDEQDLVNALDQWMLTGITREEDSDIAVVSISPLDPDNPPGREIQKDTAAQLVYTLTDEQFPAVSAVRILVDGADVSLPTDDAQTEVGQLITTDLYALYDPKRPDPTTTTTTTVPPSTTSTVAPSTTSIPSPPP